MLTTILLFDAIAITLLPLLVYYAFKRFDHSKSLFLLKDIQQNLNFSGAYKTLTLLLLLSSTVLVKGYEKYTNVKIYVPAEKSQLLDLIGLLEIDHYHEHDGAFNYTVDQEELSLLKKSGFQYEIIHEDAVKYLEEENAKYYESVKNGKSTERVAYERTGDLVDSIIKTPSAFVVQPTLGGYYRFAQMDTAIRTLKATYPTLVDTFTIGLVNRRKTHKMFKNF
jgi:hypothetical protein